MAGSRGMWERRHELLRSGGAFFVGVTTTRFDIMCGQNFLLGQACSIRNEHVGPECLAWLQERSPFGISRAPTLEYCFCGASINSYITSNFADFDGCCLLMSQGIEQPTTGGIRYE